MSEVDPTVELAGSPAARKLADFRAPEAPPQAAAKPPASIRAAVARLEESDLSPDDARALDGAEPAKGATADDPLVAAVGDDGEIPNWVVIPEGFVAPTEAQVFFIRLRAKWTSRPSKGDRQCIMWALSYTDEKLAGKRIAGDSARTMAEMTRQMIRIVDGKKVDWAKGRLANVESFWDEIGPKCRQILTGIYYKAHNLDGTELADFFTQCMHVASVHTG